MLEQAKNNFETSKGYLKKDLDQRRKVFFENIINKD